MIGIYKVIYVPENKVVYVGQSINIEERFKQHKYVMNCENELAYNTHFYRALRKYGIENFQFEVIEECQQEDLDEREIYWISYFDTFNNRYNSTIGRQNYPLDKLSKEEANEIKNALKSGKLSFLEIQKKYSLLGNTLSQINNGKMFFDENEEYPLLPTTKSPNHCVICGVEIGHYSTLCNKCKGVLQRKNVSFSINDLIKTLKDSNGNFEMAGKQYGISSNLIRKILKRENLPYHSSDYKPEKEEKEKGYNPPPKRVAKLDKETDEIVQVFGSIWEAEKGLPSGVISRVINGRRKAYHGDKYIQISEEVYQDFLNKQNQSKTNLN